MIRGTTVPLFLVRSERWAPIDETYEVSNLGNVRNANTGRVLKGSRNSDGYLMVKVPKTRSVHSLVLEAFVGPCPPGLECRHLDGNPANNRLENLAWGTHSENMQDRVRHGTHPDLRGERDGNAKLTEAQVLEIFDSTESNTALGRRFGVSRWTIGRIRSGERWKHLGAFEVSR